METLNFTPKIVILGFGGQLSVLGTRYLKGSRGQLVGGIKLTFGKINGCMSVIHLSHELCKLLILNLKVGMWQTLLQKMERGDRGNKPICGSQHDTTNCISPTTF